MFLPISASTSPVNTAMASQSQISVTVSASTKEQLDRFARSRGMKKNFVIEQALLLYLEARRTYPDDAFIPTRIVLEDEGFDALVERIGEPAAPTDALRELMRDGDG